MATDLPSDGSVFLEHGIPGTGRSNGRVAIASRPDAPVLVMTSGV